MTFVRRITGSKHGSAALVSIVAFLVYLRTLAPSVTFIDSGELAAVAITLGIAHPTGYPLFTLLARAFAYLPVATEEIVRLHVLSAFLCVAGVYVFYLLVHEVLSGIAARSSLFRPKQRESLGTQVRVAAAAASLLLAFSETYWSQAVAIEVYSLHVLLVIVTMYCFFRASFGHLWNEGDGSRSEGWWYAFAFVLGLSFTNHMTTILLAPGLLYLYFATQGFRPGSWKRIALMAVPFLAGLSVYAYLPIRAADSPALNWGNPETIERFLWHWTGKQYRVWIFSSTEAAGHQLKYFLNSLPLEFAYAGLLVAVAGVFALWRGYRKIAIGALLLFAGCVLYAINYDIHDIDSYFLLAYISIAFTAAAGFSVIWRFLSERLGKGAASVAVVLIGLMPLAFHFEKTDESGNYMVEDYTMNMFSSLQQNALVFSYQWDYWVSASYYYQLVRSHRPDVVVVDKELLRRSWYFLQLESRYPWLIRNSQSEIDAFLKELYKFEHELPYDPAVIQSRFVEMIRSMKINNMHERPVYVTTEIEPEFTAGMQRVPEGLALRVYADSLRHSMRPVEFNVRPFPRSGRLEDAMNNLYATASVAQGVYHTQNGEIGRAVEKFKEALRYNPGSIDALRLLRQVEALQHSLEQP